jgi:hypothetical protein
LAITPAAMTRARWGRGGCAANLDRRGDATGLVIVGKGDKATEGYGPQGEQHSLAAALEQHRPEANGKAADPDSLPAGGEEVPRLMDNDQASQDRQCAQHPHSFLR